MGVLFVFNAVWFRYDLIQLILVDLLAFYLLTLSIIDYHHRIIPDELSLSLLCLGLIVSFWNPILEPPPIKRLLESGGAMLAGGGGMLLMAWLGEKIFKKEALGGGDVKLVAAFGALLGWAGLFGSLFLGSLLGACVGIGLILLGKKKRGETLPFGPFLSLGAYLMCFFPSSWLKAIFP